MRRRVVGGGDSGARTAGAEGGEIAVGTAAVDGRSWVLARLLGGIGVLKSNLMNS